jgi:hypothetical protein
MYALPDFLTLILIGAAVGIAMTRYGQSWLGRHFTGASDATFALIGVAGSFMGYHLGLVFGIAMPIVLYLIAAAGAALTLWLWRGR